MLRTRFAPSPTGHLHVGGARTALFCWALARRAEGRFLLRIEDTDRKRSSAEAGLGFCADLEWLGIDWDEGPEHGTNGGGDAGPYWQSKRLDIYAEQFDRLMEAGLAYPAFETADELQAKRAQARADKVAYKYDRAALELDPDTVSAWIKEGRPHVVRFKVPSGPIVINDEVLGEVVVPDGELEDFIIRKADGYPTYHFAVVVDDALMGVTHVVRGQEHLNNTAKHQVLQTALGFEHPAYAHLSLIFNPDGSKMSKRDKDKALRAAVREGGLGEPPAGPDGGPVVEESVWSRWLESKDHQLDLHQATALASVLGVELPEIDVEDFRRAGYLPGVMVNYLALLGWSPGDDREQFDAEFLRRNFSLDRVLKSPAKFDRAKLLAFNLDAIQALDASEFHSLLRAFCDAYHPEFLERLDDAQFELFAKANHERSKTLLDPLSSGRFFIEPCSSLRWSPTKPVRKALLNGEPCGYDLLESILPELEAAEWTADSLESVIGAFAEAHADGKVGKIAQPIRIAVSGGTISPPIFDTLVILGRDRSLKRIRHCLDARAQLQAEVSA
ncbi:MAG: glutamate--tRNA ligase [Planctomycetota bacterium]|nr:glutamate--tRNA ligase [Planctomycetota bacterium]